MKRISYIPVLLVILSVLFMVTALPSTATAFQPEGCNVETGCMADCATCHKLTKDEAAKVLNTKKFSAEVVGVRMSKVKGLWEVEILSKGKKILLLMDFAMKYVLASNLTPVEDFAKLPKLKKVDRSTIPLDDAVIMGDPKAPKQIIVFDDVDCPYCRKLHKVIYSILDERKDIVFYIKLLPLPIHPKAYDKSKSIICNDRSLKLLDDAIAGKELPTPDCDTKVIDENIALAKRLGITGTPGIIFPNGALLPGFVEKEMLLNFLEENS